MTMSRSSRLTRKGLERVARELAGLRPSSKELGVLLRRLRSLQEELEALEDLTGPESEPLPSVVLEGENELWPRA